MRRVAHSVVRGNVPSHLALESGPHACSAVAVTPREAKVSSFDDVGTSPLIVFVPLGLLDALGPAAKRAAGSVDGQHVGDGSRREDKGVTGVVGASKGDATLRVLRCAGASE
jgi:hypothetical protein